jgi:hypothetical protein
MPLYLGRAAKGFTSQIGACQRCGWKYLRVELKEDEYIKGLLVCCYCWDPDHPQRYPAAPRAEGYPPMVPAPDQYPGPDATVLTGAYVSADTVDLSWTASIDNADLINEYFIWRQTNGDAAVLIASVPFETTLEFVNGEQQWVNSPTVYEDDTIVLGNTYSYYVVAQAVDHRLSLPSNIWTLCAAPVLSAGLSGENVVLNWTTPLGVVVSSFALYRGVNGATPTPLTTTAGTVLTYTDTEATAGEPNAYYVVAILASGESPPSNTATETPQGPYIVTSETGEWYPGDYEADGTGYSDGNGTSGSPYPIGSISSTVLGGTNIGSIGASAGDLVIGIYKTSLSPAPTPNFTSVTIDGHVYEVSSAFVLQPTEWGETYYTTLFWTLVGSPFTNGQPTTVTFQGVT